MIINAALRINNLISHLRPNYKHIITLKYEIIADCHNIDRVCAAV